jgi:hypothetical protein
VRRLAPFAAALALVASAVGGAIFIPDPQAPTPAGTETIYVRNVAPLFISDAEIQKDIPAWEASANVDFAPVWHTAQVKLVFIGRRSAPQGASTATFTSKGSVKNALAYHTVSRGAPAIVVYAGVADYYGYLNSVSFTHELFELLADHETSIANQGVPYAPVTVVGGRSFFQPPGTVWINEVCDPVEAFHYERDGVAISDFISPNWFNDEVNGSYDYMHLVQQPFTILKGGYAQFWTGLGWAVVQNFRHAGSDADGFLVGEKQGRS